MATDRDSASWPAAPKAEGFPRDDHSAPLSAASLAWAVTLAGMAPWRAFPVLLRASIGPLVAVYLALVAGSLALTFYDLSKAGWPAGSRLDVSLNQAMYLGAELLFLYLLLTLSGASRRQRLPETLTAGLKLSLAAWASIFLYTATTYMTMRMAGFSPEGIGASAYVIVWSCLRAYMVAAMSLAAARLADREDRSETHDPLWPRCIQCDYSLRGLPSAEAWLARREGRTSTSSTVDGGPSACPECGTTIADSLRNWDAWLAWGQKQPGAGSDRAESGGWDAGLLTSWFERLVHWVLDGRRTTGVALWLASAAILGVAITTIPVIMHRWPSRRIVYTSLDMWQNALLWTGAAGLLAGLRFSLRDRHNVIWLSQHILVPVICVGGTLLVILLVRYRHSGGIVTSGMLGLHAVFLPLVPLVLFAEWIAFRRAGRMWSAGQ